MKIHKATFRCSPSQTAFVLYDVAKRCEVIRVLVLTVHTVIDGDKADAHLREPDFTDMDKTTKNLYGVADNPGTYDGAGIFLFKLAYNFTL